MSENDPADDPTRERSESDLRVAPSTSNYKVLGRDTLQDGIGVLGDNRADSGDPVGVYGRVSNGYDGNGTPAGVYGSVPTADGYGLLTPDDARVEGELATAGSHRVTVDGDRALRLGATGNDSVGDTAGGNVVGGYRDNSANAVGATIAGGGASGSTSINDSIGTRDNTNEVTDQYGAIGGGKNNRAGQFATVGGGSAHTADRQYATIGGGESHIASGSYSTVGGGSNNEASGRYSTAGGGLTNVATTGYTTVAGGLSNEARGEHAAVGGGRQNVAKAKDATVGGGNSSEAKAEKSTVGGGSNNAASGHSTTVGGGKQNVARETASTIGGGEENDTRGPYATIGGGDYNRVRRARGTIAGGGPTNASGDPTGTRNVVTGRFGTVGGGGNNRAGEDPEGGEFPTVAGGRNNAAGRSYATVAGGKENDVTALGGTVGGGRFNSAEGDDSVVAGGASNVVKGFRASVGGGQFNAAYGRQSVVSGGRNNRIGETSTTDKGEYAAIPGGKDNVATGDYSFAAGRDSMATSNYSFALGRGAEALTGGSFVWTDSTLDNFSSALEDQFVVDADGGVGIGTTATSHERLTVKGSNSNTFGTYGDHLVGIETTTADGDVLALRNSGESDPGTGTNFVTFFDDSNTTSIGAIQGNGTSGVEYASGNEDLAEYFPKADPDRDYEDGEVVGLRNGHVVPDPTSADATMVVSTAPMVTGNRPGEERRGEFVCLALTGQVPVRVDRPVEAGEMLVATADGSAVPESEASGVAPAVVGLALEPSEDGTVKTLVGGHALEAARPPVGGEPAARPAEASDAGTAASGVVGSVAGDALAGRGSTGRDRYPDLRDRVDDLEAENVRLREQVSELTTHNEQLRGRMADLTSKNRRLEDRIATLEAAVSPDADSGPGVADD